MSVVIVKTGVANVASVTAALRRCGRLSLLSDDPQVIAEAQHVVLPGVGAFGAALSRLRAGGLSEALIERMNADRPLLGICLGMQLLFTSSDESPGHEGLGIFKGKVSAIDDQDLRVPHFGWNEVKANDSSKFLSTGYAYFANSFRVKSRDFKEPHYMSGQTSYGETFVSAIERGQLLACQFHPELSGAWGQRLIMKWLEGTC